MLPQKCERYLLRVRRKRSIKKFSCWAFGSQHLSCTVVSARSISKAIYKKLLELTCFSFSIELRIRFFHLHVFGGYLFIDISRAENWTPRFEIISSCKYWICCSTLLSFACPLFRLMNSIERVVSLSGSWCDHTAKHWLDGGKEEKESTSTENSMKLTV